MSRPRQRANSNVWGVPSIYAAGAIAAGVLVPRLEVHFWPGAGSGISAASATALYSSVASGTMALTAIVFSLTFVMVQFSATAYSPRVGLWMARDPVIVHGLGVFTATFLYAVAALAWVDRTGNQMVPLVSAWLVVALLIASVAMFIALIQRVARLQIHRMLTFIGDRGREAIATLYDQRAPADRTAGRMAALTGQVLTHRGRPCAIQAIDVELLIREARAADGTIEVLVAPGDTVVESTPLLRVVDATRLVDERTLSRAVERGMERTFEQDPTYALRLLVDIAIRALSPAVNDPTTAVQALDQMADLLLRLAGRQLDTGRFRDADRVVRVTMAVPTWDDFLRLAFDEIRTYGGTSVQVTRRMKALIADLLLLVPDERRPSLRHWETRLDRTIAQGFPDPEEQAAASTGDRQGLGLSRRSAASGR